MPDETKAIADAIANAIEATKTYVQQMREVSDSLGYASKHEMCNLVEGVLDELKDAIGKEFEKLGE